MIFISYLPAKLVKNGRRIEGSGGLRTSFFCAPEMKEVDLHRGTLKFIIRVIGSRRN